MVKALFISENLGKNTPYTISSVTVTMCLTVTFMWMSTHTLFLPSFPPALVGILCPVPSYPWCTLSCLHRSPPASPVTVLLVWNCALEPVVESRQWPAAPRRHWEKLNNRKKLHFRQWESFVSEGFFFFIFGCLFFLVVLVFFVLISAKENWNNRNLGENTVLIFFFPCYWLGITQANMLSQRECLEILLKTLTSFPELNVVNSWWFTTAPDMFLSEWIFIVTASNCGPNRCSWLDSLFCWEPWWSFFP